MASTGLLHAQIDVDRDVIVSSQYRRDANDQPLDAMEIGFACSRFCRCAGWSGQLTLVSVQDI